MAETSKASAQWLSRLFYVTLAGFILSLVKYLPVGDSWITWLQRILSAGTIVCLFFLSAENKRYRTAAICRTVQLAATLSGAALSAIAVRLLISTNGVETPALLNSASSVISIASLTASWIATYQLFHAHSELVEQADPALAKKWRQLFPASIVTALLISFATTILTVVQTVLGVGTNTITSVIFTVITLPDSIIALICLIYLRRTIRILQT